MLELGREWIEDQNEEAAAEFAGQVESSLRAGDAAIRMSPALLSKRLKELETENRQLRRAVSDLTLEKLILKEAASGNW